MSDSQSPNGGFLSQWNERFAALRNVPPVLRILWQSGPTLVGSNIALRILAALIPVATLWVSKLIIDRVVRAITAHQQSMEGLWMLLAAEFGLVALGGILGRVIDMCDALLADRFTQHISLRIMQHAAQLDLASFEDPVFYDKLERARVQATDRLGMLSGIGRLIQQAAALASLAAGVLFFSPWLMLALVICVVPAFLGESHFAFLGYSLNYRLTPARRELDYLRVLGSSRESVKEIKIFGLGEPLAQRYAGISRDIMRQNRELAGRRARAGALLSLLGSLGYYGSYAWLVYQAVHGALSVGELTFLAGAIAGTSSNLQQLFSTFSSIADQALFLSDLMEFFATKPSIRSREVAIPAPRPIRDGFEFRDVSFRYPGSGRLVLNRLNLRLEPRSRVALIGENGQGKTTLVKLMARLYDPTEGAVLLDGVDLRDYDRDDLSREIGIIFQDFVRYEMTARNNIAVGCIDAAEDRVRLDIAAHKGMAEELIRKLSKGYDQMLGRRFEGGVDLSGGEWQKFALSRAYFRDAQVLILDEPTAALDALAEYEIFRRFAELTEGKLAVLISHRFSTVRMADRIVVLGGGVIREQGTHEQLLARGGRYAEMFQLQAAGYR